MAEAIANNLDLRQAAAKVEVARQTVIIVGSQLKPQVGLDLGIASTRDEDHDEWFTSKKGLAGAAWELDIWQIACTARRRGSWLPGDRPRLR